MAILKCSVTSSMSSTLNQNKAHDLLLMLQGDGNEAHDLLLMLQGIAMSTYLVGELVLQKAITGMLT